MNKFYVVNGETLEPAITVTPTYVDANILEVDKSEVYSIDDHIWFASEKAYNDFIKDIEPMINDVDFVQMDDFDEIGTRVTIWLDDDIESSITKLYSVYAINWDVQRYQRFMNTDIFFQVCESAYTDSLIGFHPNPRMCVGHVWRTYVCYIGAYLGEKRACFVCGIRVVYFGEYTWGLYLWVYTWRIGGMVSHCS